MDVTRTHIPGTKPLQRRRALPPGPLDLAGSGARALQASGGGRTAAATLPMVGEVRGVQDGPEWILPSGIRIRCERIGAHRVSRHELQQAIRGIQLLPFQHQVVVARLGVPILLLPVPRLEQLPGTDPRTPVVGATLIDGDVGQGRPTKVRVAARVSNMSEVVQHEIGHVLAVAGSQDRSESAAEAYAARF